MTMADLGGAGQPLGGGCNWDPVHPRRGERRSLQLIAWTNRDVPAVGVDLQHVQRRARCDAEPLALADREAMNAVVPAQRLARLVDDRTGALRRGRVCRDERGVLAIRDEADLLTVRLIGHSKPERPYLSADRRLGQTADRKARTGKLILGQRKEEIRLILLRIRASLEQPHSIG